MTIRQGNKIIAGNINVEDYNTLQNKPQINSVELSGNKTLEELGIQAKGEYATKAQGSKADTAVQPATLDAYLTTESATSTYATKASLSGYATTSALEAKADKETTLAGYGITDGLSTSQITNCIVSAPNNIELEISDGNVVSMTNGTFYVPNGAGNFEKVTATISRDDFPTLQPNSQYFLYVNNKVLFTLNPVSNTVSSATQPTLSKGSFWYDTTNNEMKYCDGNTWRDYNTSFPLAILATDSDGNIIKNPVKIFNDFVGFGSSYVLLPEVKFLFANGYNDDRSVKNIEWTSDKVYVITRTWKPYGLQKLFVMFSLSGKLSYQNNYFVQEDEPSIKSYTIWYKPSARKSYYWGGQTDPQKWREYPAVYINCDLESKQEVSNFNMRTPFVAVDSNDRLWASTASKASSKFVNLTLGASGSNYTAPANGYFVVVKSNGISPGYIFLENINSGLISEYSAVKNTYASKVYIPVKAGDVVKCEYNLTGETLIFKFIFDEGAI